MYINLYIYVYIGVMACHNAAKPPSFNCSPLPVLCFKNPCSVIRVELDASLPQILTHVCLVI